MAQIGSTLDPNQKKEVGSFLLALAEKLLSEAPTLSEERQIRRAICSALSQPSINRLRVYAAGKHFPTPQIVHELAIAFGSHPLWILRLAGYDREAVRVLDHSKVSLQSVEYAVRFFPRRGERYREKRNPYFDAFIEASLPVDRPVNKRPRAKSLARAYDILGDASIRPDSRIAVAGELVRSWAYAVDAAHAHSTEQSTYIRVPGVGESPEIPLLPTGLFASLTKTKRGHQ